MFNPTTLQKLKELNINTITTTLKEAESIHPLAILPISVKPPYFFVTLYDEELFNKYIRSQNTIGYLTVNGTTTLILYIRDSEQQKKFVPIINIKSDDSNFMFTDSLTLKHTDKISIFHKSFKKKVNVDTSAQVSILDELAELSKKPNNLFYADYARKHPYFYFYKKPLESKENNFKDHNFFKLYCTLLYIAEKSNIIKQKRTQCHIYIKDLMAIIPNCFKYIRKKEGTSSPTKKKTYSKSYITFLDKAKETGLIREYQPKEEYISITFSDTFLNKLSEPPYTKIPFELLGDISSNNYKFIMNFIIKQFSNNPNKPYFIKIKIKELLKISNISLSTSNAMATDRLNRYLRILEKYQVISQPITYIADNVKKNTLLNFRLHPFKHINLEISACDFDNEENEEENEEDLRASYFAMKARFEQRE